MHHYYHDHHHGLTKSALAFAMFVSFCILLVKMYGFWVTNSMAILASAVDSMLDVISSMINLVAIILALSPPDDNHRFGKNKIEDLAVFGQSIIFFGLGVYMVTTSIYRFFHPTVIHEVGVGISMMLICMAMTVVLLAYQSYVIRKTHSRIVKADKLHYAVDLMTSAVSICSIYFSSVSPMIDPVLSICIALYVMHGAYNLFSQSIKNLIDHELTQEDKDKILEVLNKYTSQVQGIHELKTRYAGSKAFIQFHLELPGETSLFEAHQISDNISNELEQIFPGAEVTIHQDPAGVEHDVKYREVLS